MPRPRLGKRVCYYPQITYFKPWGVPLRLLSEVELSREELEALRLKNLEKLDQTACAQQMQTSQSTFQRILSSAYQKISQALVNGEAIRIEN